MGSTTRQSDRPKVLVVDDDPDIVVVCSLVLESEGYDIGIARNGCEAFDKIMSGGADVVLLDAMMPVMDGITVCKMVKRDPEKKDLPVIIMSASQTMCERARDSRADAVLPKPFQLEELVATINKLLQAK
jgi:CheY-like chemotaxis protein